jgi:hypothetical protein
VLDTIVRERMETAAAVGSDCRRSSATLFGKGAGDGSAHSDCDEREEDPFWQGALPSTALRGPDLDKWGGDAAADKPMDPFDDHLPIDPDEDASDNLRPGGKCPKWRQIEPYSWKDIRLSVIGPGDDLAAEVSSSVPKMLKNLAMLVGVQVAELATGDVYGYYIASLVSEVLLWLKRVHNRLVVTGGG